MKGIAVLTNNPDREDLSEKLAGIEERSRDFKDPVTIHIFRSRVFHGMVPGHVTGEYSIYQRLACRWFEEKKKAGGSLTILFLDMDGLKKMNDQYGHECGDYAICAITTAIKRHCGDHFLKIRMGGDEFLVMSDSLTDEQVQVLLLSIEKEIPLTEQVKHLPYPPGISVGYIHTDPESDRSLDDYVREADEFMYNEKKRKGVARK